MQGIAARERKESFMLSSLWENLDFNNFEPYLPCLVAVMGPFELFSF
jgi:hypothetical protein